MFLFLCACVCVLSVTRAANGLRGAAEWSLGAHVGASSVAPSEAAQQRAWAEGRAWAVAAQLELLGAVAQLLGDGFEDGKLE